MYRIGIDLGGTKIEGVVLDENGKVMHRERIPTESESGYEHIMENIKTIYTKLIDLTTKQSHSLGICTPGAISPKTGLLKNSNTVCLNGKPLFEDLVKTLGHPLAIENDANCFAEAEALMGAAKGCSMVFGVIMGTGCGGGLVINGKPHKGLQSIGGEWGHMSIDRNGPLCYCGKRGCAEKYISGGGLSLQYKLVTSRDLTAREIVQKAREGDSVASRIFDEFLENFGIATGNLISILDPDIIVLGGGLSNVEELYTEGRRRVEKYIFSDSLETPIVKNLCGDSAGVFGAAMIGIE